MRARVFAPAAFEQGFTGGVDIQGALVGGQVRKDAHIGPAGIDIRPYAMGFIAKAVADRVFDFEGRKVQRGQRAVLRRHFYFDALLGCKPNFPGYGGGGTVQILFAAVVGLRELHHHALCQAAMQIEQQHRAPRALQHHAAAPALNRLRG